MMNKKVILAVMIVIALVMEQVGVSNIAYAKENVEYEYDENEIEVFESYEDENEVELFESYGDENEVELFESYGDESEVELFESYGDEKKVEVFESYGNEEEEENAEEETDEEESDEEEVTDDDIFEDEEWIEPSLTKTSIKLNAGKSAKIGIDGDWEEVIWTSSKSSVAKVNQNGLVKGLKNGVATIKAEIYYYEDADDWEVVEEEELEELEEDFDIEEDEGESEETLSKIVLKCTVRVVAAPIKISAKKISLKVGKRKTLKVTGAKGRITWKSTNKRVAKVIRGKVVAVGSGKATIVAKTGGKTLTCKVVVKRR